MDDKVLIGNSYSLTLVRNGSVTIKAASLRELKSRVEGGAVVHSYWGHANTRGAAERVVGFSLKPRVERPAIVMAPDGRPTLDGETFDTCWVLSPDYAPGYRPAIGVEVDEGKIQGWQLLKLTFQTDGEDTDDRQR